MENPSYIKGESYITVVFPDGTQATAQADQPNYLAVVAAVRVQDWDEVRRLMLPSEEMQRVLLNAGVVGDVHIQDGEVFVLAGGGEYPLHNTLTDRMLEMLQEGFDITPLQLFLSNLMENPSFRAVNELYGFLEAGHLPITDDGHFIAYKRVRNDYMDLYTGTMDNSIGEVVTMPRNMVNEDKEKTCSDGLHFCSRGYLPYYGASPGARTVVLKINPRDVVAIPTDYSNAKGRCCEYEVIDELVHLEEELLEGAYADTSHIDNDDQRVAKINQVDDSVIAVYDNTKEAGESVEMDASAIRRVLRGDRKTAGGYGWKWYRDTVQSLTRDALESLEDERPDEFDDDDCEIVLGSSWLD